MKFANYYDYLLYTVNNLYLDGFIDKEDAEYLVELREFDDKFEDYDNLECYYNNLDDFS